MPTNEETFSAEEFARKVREELASALQGLGCVNIAIFGRTGVGKSTLINAVFGSKVAKTGVGKPVTEGMDYYQHPNGILGIFDSQGFEMGEAGEALIKKMGQIVHERRDKPLREQIHVVWYCLNANDRRFESGQVEFVKALADLGPPVMMVFTQVEFGRDDIPHVQSEELAAYVTSLDLPLSPRNAVYMTNAIEDADSRNPTPVHGLHELLDATFQVVPKAVAQALTAAQHLDKKRKEDASRNIVHAVTAAAAATAAIPIPLSDSAMIMPMQAVMMARVAVLWDMPVKFGTLTSLAMSAFFAQGVTFVAKAAVRSLLSLIPGVNLAAGVIKSGVAGTMTYAVGEAWIAVCSSLDGKDAPAITEVVDSPEIKRLFIEAFKSQVKRPLPSGLTN